MITINLWWLVRFKGEAWIVEKKIQLPFAPFVGMKIMVNGGEHIVQEVVYDVVDGNIEVQSDDDRWGDCNSQTPEEVYGEIGFDVVKC